MLPGVDGLSICRAVRRDTPNRDVPILMLTARRDESDKVLGLDSGADDYLTKPFGIRELLARVRAVMRRRTAPVARPSDRGQKPLAFRHIEMDPARRRVRVRGRDVELTNQEFNLLYVLLSQPGIVLSREALLRRAWPDDTFVTVRSVDTLVKRLRRKVEDEPANPTVILTVWGTGYKAADVEPKPVWYRSLYWRVGLGFVAFLGPAPVAQALLFVWLASQTAGAFPAASGARLAELIASDIRNQARVRPRGRSGRVHRERIRPCGAAVRRRHEGRPGDFQSRRPSRRSCSCETRVRDSPP